MSSSSPKRTAGITCKSHLFTARCVQDPVDRTGCIRSEYISAALNQRSGCLANQKSHYTGIASIHAFASNRAICLCSADSQSNGDLRVFQTLTGHVAEICSISIITPFGGPTQGSFESFLVSGSTDGVIKLWTISKHSSYELASWRLSSDSSVCIVHGCYLTASELLIAAIGQMEVIGWSFPISPPTSCEIQPISSIPLFTVDHNSPLCLSIRLLCLPLDSSGTTLAIIFLGLSNGQLEIWTSSSRQGAHSLTQPILSGSLKAHTDWLRCLDCITLYENSATTANENDAVKHVLVATGSQDNSIRVWHLYLFGENISDFQQEVQKGVVLNLPTDFNSRRFLAHLDCALAGHENWVTGVSWSSEPWKRDSIPRLLSSSMDKSLVVWSPSKPLLSNTPATGDGSASSTSDLWLEKMRFGTVGGNQLGFLDCAWGDNSNFIFGHGFHGSLSTWSCYPGLNVSQNITLTGHFGPVTDLCWSQLPKGSSIHEDALSEELPVYLLTASRDQSLRLHGLFSTLGSGCNPPVCTWRELARPQSHGYEMNAVACLDAFRFVSAGDEKVVRVFSATASFATRFFSDTVVSASPGLIDSLPSNAIQPALGLSNQAASIIDGQTVNSLETSQGNPVELGDPHYPPTEDALANSTLWTEVHKLYGHSYEVYCVACHPKGTLIASACKSSKKEFASIFLWRTDNWSIFQKLEFHQLTVTQLRFDTNGEKLLSVSRDRSWCLWKSAQPDNTGEESSLSKYAMFKTSPAKGGHTRIIWACGWMRDNRTFLTGSRDKQIFAWDSETASILGKGLTMTEPVTALDIGPALPQQTLSGASLVAVGLENGSINLIAVSLSYEPEPLALFTTLTVLPDNWSHPGFPVRRLVFCPYWSESYSYPSRLASAGDDGLVRILSINTDMLRPSSTVS